ncbi:MAG: GNAT family N-acetyltransferase [Sedimentibacter sp.]|uniref:GNAT family N-acetyltransferase n=1 Tax=Sedimentibacter sp. TaxID=1960295 RepID=UPI0031583663
MKFSLQLNCENIDWNNVSELLKRVGMGFYDGDVHRKAFENSHSVVFAFDGKQLIGFGRAISDGAYEAAVYDIAVVPEYQGKGVGKSIVESIMQRLPQCNIILFASPGKEPFYKKLHFRKMKTGMALFIKEEQMQSDGFIE